MLSAPHQHIILYAEDDPDDFFLVQQAFQQYQGSVQLLSASNGFESLKTLNELHIAGRLPCLIVLDVNMPGMDGKEALIRIKQTQHLKNIPVILFTTSSSEVDKNFAKKWGAGFTTKPLIYPELEELVRNFLNICSDKVPGILSH